VTTTYRQRTFWSAFVGEPIQLAISQPHQVAISSISVSLMAIFFGSSEVVPWAAAIAGAIGVEYAYLKGMSDAAYTESVWGGRLIKAAFAIIVIAGTSVLLKDAYHVDFMVDPHPAWALVLALLHILPLAYLGLCSANLHIEAESRRVKADREADEHRAAEQLAARQRQLERERAEEDRLRRKAEAADEIERQRLARLADVETMEATTLARQRLRAAASQDRHSSVTAPVSEPRHAASQSDRATFYAAVVTAYRNDPNFNRQGLADAHGWSRPMVGKLIKEAQQKGDL
jgi:hypothetical protein